MWEWNATKRVYFSYETTLTYPRDSPPACLDKMRKNFKKM
ncbi:hypothetical protein [Singapore grouper iridovirus]|nr:hypothetical protein [Singapore grouper iridovirus]